MMQLFQHAKDFLTDPLSGIIYGLITLVYMLLIIIVPTRIIIQNSILTWFSPVLAVIGFMFVLLNIFMNIDQYKQKEMRIPCLLILVLFLSTIVNYDRGLIANINTIIWQANLLLFVFPSCIQMGKRTAEKHQDNMVLTCASVVQYTLFLVLMIIDIAVVWSLIQYFQLYYREILTDVEFFRMGLYEGRLIGVFVTPYLAALINSYAVSASVFYIMSSKRKGKLFFLVSCFLSTTMIVLSGTRSVMLGILLSIAVIMAMILVKRTNGRAGEKIKLHKKVLAVLLASMLSAGVYLAQAGYFKMLQEAAIVLNADGGAISSSDIARKDKSGNISSNRFEIWRDYAHVLIDRPEKLILGYSQCGYMEYIRNYYPNLFIVQYFKEKYPLKYEKKNEVYDPHNTALNVLVSTGLIGLSFVIIFAVTLYRIILMRYRQGKLRMLDYFLITILITTATALMFETDVFYQCSFTSIVFWMMTGFLSGRYAMDVQAVPSSH